MLDCFEDLVKPALFESANRAVLLVAHSNTLRALMAAIDEVPDDDVPALHVPNSVPILYRFDVDRGAPVSVKLCKGSGTQSHARWMLTPENHAQVHDALESGGLLTRAFFESVELGAGQGRFDVASTWVCRARACWEKASRALRGMIARPRMSRNEWNMTESGPLTLGTLFPPRST